MPSGWYLEKGIKPLTGVCTGNQLLFKAEVVQVNENSLTWTRKTIFSLYWLITAKNNNYRHTPAWTWQSLVKYPEGKTFFSFFYPSEGSKYYSIDLINRDRKSHCSFLSTLITVFGIYPSIFASHYESQMISYTLKATEDRSAKSFYRTTLSVMRSWREMLMKNRKLKWKLEFNVK